MIHVTILASPCSNLGSIDNPRRGFLFVNDCLARQGLPPLFHVQMVGTQRAISINNGLYTLHTDALYSEIRKTDLIIWPAFDGGFEEGIEQNAAFVPWVIKQYKQGAELASLCVGAFLLASTGLLEGKNCSTHWRAVHDFRRLFPQVQLVADKIITDEQRIYTSGGAFSSANLIVYIIQKYAGRELAVHCAKIFQIDMDRQWQSPFIIFQGQKDHQDEQVMEVQDFIEKNYREKITVEALSSYVALSRRNLERRFKRATTNTIVEYMQRVKIEAVKNYLETGRKTISELMYEVGYSDIKSFRTVFKKYTGLSPVEYRNKYHGPSLIAN